MLQDSLEVLINIKDTTNQLKTIKQKRNFLNTLHTKIFKYLIRQKGYFFFSLSLI